MALAHHSMPGHDSIDHDASATSPLDLDQCVCGPDWERVTPEQDEPRYVAIHHHLHGTM